ncbi:response regulator [Phaeovulum sp. W22_SRMD_FR3]|uniref:response regulator n=1 Tax=Phaeovulum sp. W22_SRMD_FR3 TaxID=3240274 RepID=UPI003F9B9DDE
MTDTRTMSVLIADDHQLIREMIAHYLREQPELEVDMSENLDSALLAIATRGGYDVVLLDYTMPGMAGLAGVTRAVEANAGRAVVLFSGNASRETVASALENGARGFIPKTLPAKSLLNAIRFVLAGEIFLPMSYMTDPEPNTAQSGWSLSPQETRVLKKLCEGKTNKEIARDLNLSEVTIKMYMRSICTRLGAKNRTHAAMIANQHSIC